jgi:pimeloyl-ACP methyl ester carboxylesterase
MIDSYDIDAPGGRLAAFRLGPDADHAPLVLAVHGITANSHAWLAVARALDDRVTLIAPDLRGRGASSELPGPYGVAAHVQDMLAVLDHFGCADAVLVGHSLGAYVATALAVAHPERVRAAVLVDGGLPIPGSEGVEPQAFLDAFLGPALARLGMTFRSREDYREWWREHPAIAGSDVAPADLAAFADHDLTGEEPQLRSGVAEPAVRADAADLFTMGEPAQRLAVPATLLCAPRGLLDDPRPMQPLALVQTWAAGAPGTRRAIEIPDVNHYTIALGQAGADAVARTLIDVVARAAHTGHG